jgi:hypothetical protein
MTAGTEPATVNGPLIDVALYQTPLSQANHDCSSTLMMGVPLLAT